MLIFDDDLDVSINWHHKKISTKNNIFEKFVRQHIICLTDEPIEDEIQYIIDGINNYELNDLYKNSISIMTNVGHFSIIMKRAIKYFGNDGNYNWIDTSSCTSFLGLFASPAFRNFNGDITEWDTSNVNCMLKTFQGCKAFTRDITGWDVKNVQAINKDTYAGASAELKEMFQTMKKDGCFGKYPLVKL